MIDRSTTRDTPTDPMALSEVALLFGTPVAETILASVHVRAHKKAGHMDASDLIKPRNNRARRGLVVTLIRRLLSFTQWCVRLNKPHIQKFGHSQLRTGSFADRQLEQHFVFRRGDRKSVIQSHACLVCLLVYPDSLKIRFCPLPSLPEAILLAP